MQLEYFKKTDEHKKLLEKLKIYQNYFDKISRNIFKKEYFLKKNKDLAIFWKKKPTQKKEKFELEINFQRDIFNIMKCISVINPSYFNEFIESLKQIFTEKDFDFYIPKNIILKDFQKQKNFVKKKEFVQLFGDFVNFLGLNVMKRKKFQKKKKNKFKSKKVII